MVYTSKAMMPSKPHMAQKPSKTSLLLRKKGKNADALHILWHCSSPTLIRRAKMIITRCRRGIKIKLQHVGISRDRIYETIMEANWLTFKGFFLLLLFIYLFIRIKRFQIRRGNDFLIICWQLNSHQGIVLRISSLLFSVIKLWQVFDF